MTNFAPIVIGLLLSVVAYSGVYLDDMGETFQIVIGTVFFVFSVPWNGLVAILCAFLPKNIIFLFLQKEASGLLLYFSYFYIGTVVGTFINGYLLSRRIILKKLTSPSRY